MTASSLRRCESLSRFLEARAAATPAATALLWQGERIDVAGLLDESRRLAGALSELGIARGDRVALWLPNCPAWLALFFACARLGAIAVAVNTRFRSSEIADIVARSGAKLLVLWPGFRQIDFLAILDEVDRAALDRLEHIVTVGDAVAGRALVQGKTVLTYEALRHRPSLGEDHGEGPVGCVIFTTSGTTKAPKFVLHDHYSVRRHAEAVAKSFGYDQPEHLLLQALPFCGVFGFCQALAALAGGTPIVVQPTFEAEATADLIDRHRVTIFNGSDEMFARVLATRRAETPFPSLRSCKYAAFNPTMDGIVTEAERRGLRLGGLYGMSEVQALFARQPEAAPAAVRARPGGFPVGDDYAVRVRDPENGILLPPGESGELEFTGPSLMAGYFADEAATDAAMTADGWVRSGDLGRLVGDGSFIFETRMGDVLRLSGFLVAPSEIEAHLQALPEIEGCQVVGARTTSGLKPVAFVTLRAGAAFDEAAARRHCKEGLAGFKVPERCVVLDAFPTTPSANGTKIQRVKLREMAQLLLSE